MYHKFLNLKLIVIVTIHTPQDKSNTLLDKITVISPFLSITAVIELFMQDHENQETNY